MKRNVTEVDYSVPADAPQVIIPFSVITAFELQPLILSVEVDANPFPSSIIVTPPSQDAIKPILSFNGTSNGIQIIFPSVRRSNSGKYTLKAVNSFGNGSEDFDIEVYCMS